MQPIEIWIVILRRKKKNEKETSYSLIRGGGVIDVGLLSQSHHNIGLIAGEDLLSNEGFVPFLWITSYTTLLRDKSPISHYVWPKLVSFLKCFGNLLHHYYEWLKWCYFVFDATYD